MKNKLSWPLVVVRSGLSVIIFLLPTFVFAFTDGSTYPTMTPWNFQATFNASDMAACLASNPLDDRFELHIATLSFIDFYDDVLFAGFTGPVTLATSSSNALGNAFYFITLGCSQGQGNLDYGARNLGLSSWVYTDTFVNTPIPFSSGGGGSTTLATSSVTEIDNPNQDYFEGVFIFFFLAGAIVFIFKKR